MELKEPEICPFVKWAGGKRQLLSEIKKRMPPHYINYYEPFVGGGAGSVSCPKGIQTEEGEYNACFTCYFNYVCYSALDSEIL